MGIVISNATGTFELMYPEARTFLLYFWVSGLNLAFYALHFGFLGLPCRQLPLQRFAGRPVSKVGVYAVARVLPPSDLLIPWGHVWLFCGRMALLRRDLRRLLSYHIISQVGYMVAAVGLGCAISVDRRAFTPGKPYDL